MLDMRNFLIFGLVCFTFSFAAAQREKFTTNASPTSKTNTPATATSRSTENSNKSAATRSENQQNSPTTSTTAKRRTTPRTQQTYPAPSAPKLETPTISTTDKTPASDAQANAKTNTTHLNAAPEQPLTVQWLTIEEVEERSKTVKKKVFIDIYTSWCGWCKRMDETTFSDPAVVKYLNENYYAVKLDAEQQQEINFKGKTYQFKKMGKSGYNELAIELLNNRLSFPTAVFLNEDFEIIQSLATYLDAPKFETIINYFATDHHKKTPWEAYERNFVPQSLHHRRF